MGTAQGKETTKCAVECASRAEHEILVELFERKKRILKFCTHWMVTSIDLCAWNLKWSNEIENYLRFR